jgi:hypothetical protein
VFSIKKELFLKLDASGITHTLISNFFTRHSIDNEREEKGFYFASIDPIKQTIYLKAE